MSGVFESVDSAFDGIPAPGAELRWIADGFEFTEGPAWFQGGLVFSDIPADTIYRWTQGEGHAVWRRPSHHANGNTVDPEGRLITCEHATRRVSRTEIDGSITILASTYKGKRLNSPNDAVVRSDRTIWFTDPPYGIRPEEVEQPDSYVFRLDPGSKEPVAVCGDFSLPNGLCFSPDEQLLYVADSDPGIVHVRRFRVRSDDRLEGGEAFATVRPGLPDGMRIDIAGRLFVCAGDGVQVFDPDGHLLGKIRTPEGAANCAFGGEDKRTLFITARKTLWAVELATEGR